MQLLLKFEDHYQSMENELKLKECLKRGRFDQTNDEETTLSSDESIGELQPTRQGTSASKKRMSLIVSDRAEMFGALLRSRRGAKNVSFA